MVVKTRQQGRLNHEEPGKSRQRSLGIYSKLGQQNSSECVQRVEVSACGNRLNVGEKGEAQIQGALIEKRSLKEEPIHERERG